MDEETRERYLAAFRSLWSGRGFTCDLTHDSPSEAPILQPTLILRGAHDRPVPPAHAARLAALAQNHDSSRSMPSRTSSGLDGPPRRSGTED